MVRTIVVGSCVFVQGILEKTLPDGRISIRVGERIYTGAPVLKAA